ncbi:MAG: MCE family protein [Thiomargarita sp.]|nr:MCE family protein [Thiomargarita sp.]
MESKVNYAIIGLFVILLSLMLCITIIWLSVGTEHKTYQTYQVFIQESVSGLNHKASVKYRGVTVGYVRDIALVPERPNDVRILLEIEIGVPLKRDTFALLSTQGLTGLAYIELTGSSVNALPPLHETGQAYPELKTQSSLFVRLDTAVSKFLGHVNHVEPTVILNKIDNLYNHLNVFLSPQNQTSVSNILQNMDHITSVLATRTNNVDLMLSNLLEMTEKANRVFASFENTSIKFSETAQDISKVIKKGNKDLDYFTRQSLPEMTHTVRELRLLSTHLRLFIQELERKPNILLFGK